jgi:hypothetical protein
MPVTAGTPAKDLTRLSSLIAPPFMETGQSSRDRLCEPGKVRGEPVDIVHVVLNRQQPLLHLPPWREKYTAIVLHQPVQVAESGVDLEEVAKLADPVATERHAA